MDITVENIGTLEIPADLEAAILTKYESKVPEFLTGKGFVVKPQADYDSAIKTAEDTAVKKAVGEESAKLYGNIDGLLAIALNEAKPDKMKTGLWVQKLQEEGKLPLSDEAMKTLRDKLKGSSETKDALIEGLRNELNTEKQNREKDKNESFKQEVKAMIKADFRNAPVHVSADIKEPAKIKEAQDKSRADITTFFNTLYEPKKNDDGETYFVKKGTDAPLMNVAENRPMSPTEIIRAHYPMHLAPAEHKQTGGGTGKPNTGGQPGSFTSLAEIRQYAIKEKGFAPYSAEFDKFVSEERTKAKL